MKCPICKTDMQKAEDPYIKRITRCVNGCYILINTPENETECFTIHGNSDGYEYEANIENFVSKTERYCTVYDSIKGKAARIPAIVPLGSSIDQLLGACRLPKTIFYD